jgi:cyanate permease
MGDRQRLTRATHFNSIAIGVGNAVMPSVVRQGAAAGSGKYSAHTAL